MQLPNTMGWRPVWRIATVAPSDPISETVCGEALKINPDASRTAIDAKTTQVARLHLGNFLRTLATPEPIKGWSLTSLKEKLIKIGAKVVSHGRYVAFQMAEVPSRDKCSRRFCGLIAELRPPPPPVPT